MKVAEYDRNQALAQLAARVNAGFARFYDGVRKDSPDVALSGNTQIAEVPLGASAFGAPSAGVITSNPASAGTVTASGSPTFVRFFRADGATAVADMKIPEEVVLEKSSWSAGEPFAAPTFTWSLPVGT
jgi:hypothetical protein